MIGYGTENGVDYWLCANTWGSQWGDEGYFKISQTDTDSDMSWGVAGTPDKKSEPQVEFVN